jgi:hypothetical protein
MVEVGTPKRPIDTKLVAEQETPEIQIGQKVEFFRIPEGSRLVFRVEGKEGLYCRWHTGHTGEYAINKIFKAEEGQFANQWVVIPADYLFLSPNTEVEIVDTWE